MLTKVHNEQKRIFRGAGPHLVEKYTFWWTGNKLEMMTSLTY